MHVERMFQRGANRFFVALLIDQRDVDDLLVLVLDERQAESRTVRFNERAPIDEGGAG